jgi:hypothetical protein
MKLYRVDLSIFEDGSTHPNAKELVNVEDSSDRILCHPSAFSVGDIVSEYDFHLIECNMAEEYCTGTAMFAFEGSKQQKLLNSVIERLKQDFEQGDYTVLEELLSFIPAENLIQSLPEDQWEGYHDLVIDFESNDYFEIVSAGYNEDLQREEIQIHAGENGNIFLIKTEEGFIVDVYNQTENVNTMAIWEEELTPDDESIPDELIPDEDKVYAECEYIYNEKGMSSLIDHVEEQLKIGNPLYKNVVYERCTPCETETPHLNNVCLVCGNYKS